jgi:hypothetical protein
MPNQQPPFDETDLEQINERLKELDEADRIMTQALQAGVEVQPHQQRSQELRQKLLRMKQAFFPGK